MKFIKKTTFLLTSPEIVRKMDRWR